MLYVLQEKDFMSSLFDLTLLFFPSCSFSLLYTSHLYIYANDLWIYRWFPPQCTNQAIAAAAVWFMEFQLLPYFLITLLFVWRRIEYVQRTVDVKDGGNSKIIDRFLSCILVCYFYCHKLLRQLFFYSVCHSVGSIELFRDSATLQNISLRDCLLQRILSMNKIHWFTRRCIPHRIYLQTLIWNMYAAV